LHESLPIWLTTGEDLQKLRAAKDTDTGSIRPYLRKTALWLHLLYRSGEPFGYVHGHQPPRGKHTVTNVSVTAEARLIRQAIDEVDRTPTDDTAQAGLWECPKVGLAGVVVLPRRVSAEPLICLFRDPEAVGSGSAIRLMTGRELVERLRTIPSQPALPHRPLVAGSK
jgi:hypothetical protein